MWCVDTHIITLHLERDGGSTETTRDNMVHNRVVGWVIEQTHT